MISRGLLTCSAIAVALGALLGAAAPAQDEKPAATPPVAAIVNGEPIYVSEVNRLLQRASEAGVLNSGVPSRAVAGMLKQMIHRRLALQALKRQGGYVTDDEVNQALETVKSQAASQKLTLEQFATKQGVSVDTFRSESAWQIAWNHYVERHLTDEMESYFQAHQKEFDGTKVRASHILLRPDRASDSNDRLIDRAKQIREEITSGKLTFEQAAEKYSAGPSGKHGGDLGFIPRFGVMFDDFANAAFHTEIGDVSEPVVTPFGVHLIRVTQVTPGTKQWTEVIEQMRPPASVDLFDRLAQKEADAAKIEYTGTIPYFDPATGELVMPKTAIP